MKKIRLNIIISIMIFLSFIFVGCSKKVENPVTRIGIIGAMDEEVDLLKKNANITNIRKIAEMEFCEAILNDKNVVIVKCGMGKVNAGICAQTLISDFNCNKIINTGVAGSLDNKLNIGDIVVSVDAVQHDYDVTEIGFKKGEIPYTGLYAFPADEGMRAVAKEVLSKSDINIKYYEGRICSGDQFISTKEEKYAITSNFGGLCCEMEGAAIAQVCYLNKTPYLIIRAISDKDEEAEDEEYELFKVDSAKNSATIVSGIIDKLD